MYMPRLPHRLRRDALEHLPALRDTSRLYGQVLQEIAALVLDKTTTLDADTQSSRRLRANLHALYKLCLKTINASGILGVAIERLFVASPDAPDWHQILAWDIEDAAAPTD